MIFWGLPLRSTWKNQGENDFAPNITTEVKVLKQLKGKVPSKVKIKHMMNIGACGITYPLGETTLIVVEPSNDGHYFADEMIVKSAPNIAIVAYLLEGIDVSTTKAFRVLHWDFDYEEECGNTNNDVNTKSPNGHCIPQNTIDKIMDAYFREYDQVTKIEPKSWWKKFISREEN